MREKYATVLRSYMDIYELFPLFHPYVLATIHKSVWKQKNDEKDYLFVIIDAISSLISLYTTQDKAVAKIFYESAKKRLGFLKRVSIEVFIARTILVSVSTFCWNANL